MKSNRTFSCLRLPLLLAAALVSIINLSAAVPAFPGAQGFGSQSLGGRGPGGSVIPQILEVTSLEDYELADPVVSGSLRQALEASNTNKSFYIIFKVAGVIRLKRALAITNPYTTLAGQTAPDPGITIEGDEFFVRAHNVIVQHMKFRAGTSVRYGPYDSGRNSLGIQARDPATSIVHNVVVDRCSISWGIDQNFNSMGSGPWSTASGAPGMVSDFTVSNCLFAEPLYKLLYDDDNDPSTPLAEYWQWYPAPPPHPDAAWVHQTTGFNVLITAWSRNLTFARNVMAYSNERVPYMKGQMSHIQLVNNFSFGTGTFSNRFAFGEPHSNPPTIVTSVKGNVVHLFPQSPGTSKSFIFDSDAVPPINIYENDNAVFHTNPTTDVWYRTAPSGTAWSSSVWTSPTPSPVTKSSIETISNGLPVLDVGPITVDKSAVETALLPAIGARAGQRDVVDARIISNIESRNYAPAGNGQPYPHVQNDFARLPEVKGMFNHPTRVVNTGPTTAGPGNGCHPADASTGIPNDIPNGYPTARVTTAITHALPVNLHADNSDDGYVAGNGYTNIEEWLHRKAKVVETKLDPLYTTRSDNFEDGNDTGWTRLGTYSWSFPTDGSKVYHQDNKTGEAISLLAGSNSTDYSIEARVKIFEASPAPDVSLVSLIARYADSDNFYTLQLRADNKLKIKRRLNGSVTDVGEFLQTFAVGTWYTLKFEVSGKTLKGYVNNVLRLTITDATIPTGSAGVSTWKAKGRFDDVVLDPAGTTAVAEDFQDSVANGWTPNGTHSWSFPTDPVPGSNKVYKQTNDVGAAGSKTGMSDASTQSIEARAKVESYSGSGSFGLTVRDNGSGSYYYLGLFNDNTIRLRKISPGTSTDIQKAVFYQTALQWYTLKLSITGSGTNTLVSGYVDGQLMVQTNDTTPLPSGRAGVAMYKAKVSYDDVLVNTP